MLFSSCNKEELDPILEIYISTKESQMWSSADIDVYTIRFQSENEFGDTGHASLKNYNGIDYNVSLEQEEKVMIYNDRFFELENIDGLSLLLSELILSNGDAGISKIDLPSYRTTTLDKIASLKNGKSYSIEFILDFDNLVFDKDGRLTLGKEYDIVIDEL